MQRGPQIPTAFAKARRSTLKSDGEVTGFPSLCSLPHPTADDLVFLRPDKAFLHPLLWVSFAESSSASALVFADALKKSHRSALLSNPRYFRVCARKSPRLEDQAICALRADKRERGSSASRSRHRVANPVHEPPSPLPQEIFDGDKPKACQQSQAGDLTAVLNAPELNTLLNRMSNAQIIQQLLIFKVTLNSSFQEKAELPIYPRISLHSEELETAGERLGVFRRAHLH